MTVRENPWTQERGLTCPNLSSQALNPLTAVHCRECGRTLGLYVPKQKKAAAA